ncbi:hypothetical protein J6590_101920 [Homalodisca vitripennis]|nr:hypothetical protein J6590_101920 [Homalodisca vitripennis]
MVVVIPDFRVSQRSDDFSASPLPLLLNKTLSTSLSSERSPPNVEAGESTMTMSLFKEGITALCNRPE